MKTLTTPAAERALLATVLPLLALAALAPAVPLPAGYHHFADQRTLAGLPHAMDVLTNLPFAVVGAWGLALLRRAPTLAAPLRALAGLFFAGLALTALCSGIYHLRPDATGLALDRLGMGLAFAGVLGLAAAERVSARAGVALAALVAATAPAAAALDWLTGNMTPWAVLQAGGVLLLALLAMRPARPQALGFSILGVIAWYALAKALELADHALFHALQGVVSGHSLKHMAAALAAGPILAALRRWPQGRLL
ncbi:hypothetical protein EII20_11835 [Comamonadaceae bacterium OH2545_COT-014]|nr:hypothetical protein EII20_11835 [Comamonadaceae bacterium OH2545_COT-014]